MFVSYEKVLRFSTENLFIKVKIIGNSSDE